MIDGELRKVKLYSGHRMKTREFNYDKDEKLDGLQSAWWEYGDKKY
jgi:hypothetical protein